MNQYYSAELSQKVTRGMKETRMKGLYQGGSVLYGYKIVDRKFVIDESEAEVVRYMFDQYSKGVYVRNIIKDLTAKGILYKGKPFICNSVHNILKNEKYSGKYMHGDEVVDNMYPQIIDEELFQKVRKIVNANKFGKKSLKVDYLLRGKLKCGYCGESINGESGTTKAGIKFYYYKCNGRKKRVNDCNKEVIRKEVLEELVIANIIEDLGKPEILDGIVNKLMTLQNEEIKANSTLSLLLKQQTAVETSLNNLVAAIERGIMSNTTNKRLQELEAQQLELERQILIEKSKTQTKLSEQEIRQYFENALRLEPQMLISYLIKEIKLYDDKIEIYYNNPTRIGPDDSQGFFFYCKQIEIYNYYAIKKYTIYMGIK
jgi:hypothetical protein